MVARAISWKAESEFLRKRGGLGRIAEGQIVGDIIHEADLFTTFARLAGATNDVPGDRIIDGIDQTALLMNGDTHSRRDYVFIYAGPNLGRNGEGQLQTSLDFVGPGW